MRILLTNNTLSSRAGSELYVRDVAMELMRRGHHPVAYSSILGPIAEELRKATVPVIQSLSSLGEAPDIIHGHHHYDTLAAMTRFPETPAIYYCHGWTPMEEAALHFPRIVRYVAVDELCRERLIAECGIAPDRIELILNFFDGNLFRPRGPLPAQPGLALVFSNDFDDTALKPVKAACKAAGIELHAAGIATGSAVQDPGALLLKYDLVFAKARAAIEAMAVGACVVLSAPGRLGPVVTPENFTNLRALNFGVRTLSMSLTEKLLMERLQDYRAGDAAKVSDMVRTQCEVKSAVDRIVDLYQRAIAEARQWPAGISIESERSVSRYLETHAGTYKASAFRQHALALEAQRMRDQCQAAQNESADKAAELVRMEAEAAVLRQEKAMLKNQLEALAGAAATEHDQVIRLDAEAALLKREIVQLQNAQAESVWQSNADRENLVRLEQEGALLRSQKSAIEQSTAEEANRLLRLEREITLLRSSASWRISQRVLRHPIVRSLFGGIIRRAAKKAQTSLPH